MYKRKRVAYSKTGNRTLGVRKRYRSFQTSRFGALARTGGNYSAITRRRYPNGIYRVGPGPEKKFIDSGGFFTYAASAGTTITTVGTPTMQLLNGLVQGTDSVTRIGRKIMMKSIQIRNAIGKAVQTSSSIIRTIVFYDTQTNGAAPVVTDLLQASTLATYIVSPLNLNNRERFRILWDKTDVVGADGADNAIVYQDYYKKLNMAVIFNASNAGTVADIQTGSVYALTMGTLPTANAYDIATYVRIRFIDD